MSKEITKTNILQAIQDKFKLRDLEPERFVFQETVVPVYDIDQHLREFTNNWIEKSITSGPGGFNFMKVPPTERWFLRAYNVVFMAAGAYTVTGLYILRNKGISGGMTYIDMTEGQTVSYAVNLPQLIPLDPGDYLYIYIDSYTSTAGLRLYIDYMKETIR